MTEKQKLMKNLQMYSFAVVETGLFLDTHPYNKKALEYFNKVKMLKDKAQKEYERKYGPVVMTSNESDDKWDWALSKWPWEVDD